jgi:glycosyltransferase involved in cell wall biosynthesis
MKVFFIGEIGHPNSETWLRWLREYGNCEIETWSLNRKRKIFPRFFRILDWLDACLFLGKKIKKSNPDLLICERVTSSGFIGACSGFHPFVVSQQGITEVWPQNSFSTPFKSFLAKYTFKKADMIHAWGSVMVPAMLELGAVESKIKVRPKGIDLNLFAFRPGDKSQEKIKAIVTRSLTTDYHHDVIIKAARLLKDKNIPVEITIIGDGFLKEELMKMASELDVNDIITWKGRILNKVLPGYLSEANLYLSVPSTEGVSGSLFEAMATGAFPIVTDLPGTKPWIIHGENGYLIPVNDPEALAEHILKAWNDKNFIKEAILKNRQIVEEKADFEKNMPVFLNWYSELVAK